VRVTAWLASLAFVVVNAPFVDFADDAGLCVDCDGVGLVPEAAA
jgi:hypothetical protein